MIATVTFVITLGGCGTVDVPTGPTTAPVTDLFENQLGVQGSATRSFTVRDTGVVSVTLTSVGPPADVAVGLGIGIPRSGGSACAMSQSVTATASTVPQLTTTAEGGAYCVRIFDVGALTGDVRFSVSVQHP